ncbi:hypothetical protein LCGC14_2147570, partial [marine sediment metagenome]
IFDEWHIVRYQSKKKFKTIRESKKSGEKICFDGIGDAVGFYIYEVNTDKVIFHSWYFLRSEIKRYEFLDLD